MTTELMDISILKRPDWHATHILRPDLLVLSASISMYGILSPIIVRKETNEIIDGYQRWKLVSEIKDLQDKFNSRVPVKLIDCDSIWARILHIQLNRGRGYVLTDKLSTIIRQLTATGMFTDEDFDKLLTIKYDELEVLLDATIIKRSKIKEHTYSRAWVPVEAPAGTVGSASIEVPPNPDR